LYWDVYGPAWGILTIFLSSKYDFKRIKRMFWFESKWVGVASLEIAVGEILEAEILFWIEKNKLMMHNYFFILK
jgi:hypothetical protein